MAFHINHYPGKITFTILDIYIDLIFRFGDKKYMENSIKIK